MAIAVSRPMWKGKGHEIQELEIEEDVPTAEFEEQNLA
jgi:hypothetical protein